MEDYDKIKKVLALGFMHFLDENRTEGKMCLSNGECADIEKAFNEQDWPKLVRYLDKYRESEDERVIRTLFFLCKDHDWLNGATKEECLNWLEKQKEIQFGVPGLYYYNGEKVYYYGSPATEENLKKQEVDFSTNDTSKNDARKRRQIIALLSASKGKCMASFAKDIDECVAYLIEKQKEQKPSIFPPGLGEVHWNPIPSGKDAYKWNLPEDFEEAVYKVANFISPFDSQEELRKVSHRFAEQLLDIAKKDLQKSVWSEEDEKMICNILNVLTPNLVYTTGSGTRTGTSTYKYDKEIAWLKSLRPQPKQVWTEEDDRICHLIMANLSESARHAITLPMETVNDFNNWLRTLQCMSPVFTDWNEEDQTLLSDALGCVTMVQELKKRGKLKNFHISCSCDELRSWIRSLKSRPRKQPSWKPTEEQMEALNFAITYFMHETNYKNPTELRDLYEQLKKL